MEINGINLDVACSQLVSEIEAVVPVKFTQWDNHYYSSVLKKNEDGSPREAGIQFKLPLEIPKIAHELLHMKVGLTMGDNGCMLTIPGKSFWYRIFVKHGIVAQILNLCEHVIFSPTIWIWVIKKKILLNTKKSVIVSRQLMMKSHNQE